MRSRLQIILSSRQIPGTPIQPSGFWSRIKRFWAGVALATVGVAVLIAALILGSVIAVVLAILLMIWNSHRDCQGSPGALKTRMWVPSLSTPDTRLAPRDCRPEGLRAKRIQGCHRFQWSRTAAIPAAASYPRSRRRRTGRIRKEGLSAAPQGHLSLKQRNLSACLALLWQPVSLKSRLEFQD
jgi:hypothetical protein